MSSLVGYEMQPFRAGQVAVARCDRGLLHAYRSTLSPARLLGWELVDPTAPAAAFAILGFKSFELHLADGAWRPQCALSQRQLAQLIAHRAAILGLQAGSDTLNIGAIAVDSVLVATLGQNIPFALEQLPKLGLDIGYSADRHALQLVINAAEKNGSASLLNHLPMQPCAKNGLEHASDWLRRFGTPEILNELGHAAADDALARQLLTSRRSPAFDACA